MNLLGYENISCTFQQGQVVVGQSNMEDILSVRVSPSLRSIAPMVRRLGIFPLAAVEIRQRVRVISDLKVSRT